MKLLKEEKIWLISVSILFLAYNIPGIPSMHSSTGLRIHSLLTVIPLWLASYIGMNIVFHKRKLKDEDIIEEKNESEEE